MHDDVAYYCVHSMDAVMCAILCICINCLDFMEVSGGLPAAWNRVSTV